MLRAFAAPTSARGPAEPDGSAEPTAVTRVPSEGTTIQQFVIYSESLQSLDVKVGIATTSSFESTVDRRPQDRRGCCGPELGSWVAHAGRPVDLE